MRYVLNSNETVRSCLEHITSVNVEQKPIQVVTISNFKRDRTAPQNRYYFGVVVPMMADCYGDSKEEMHEYLKRKFLTPKKVTVNGFTFELMPSTTKLSTSDFNAYIELCCRHAAQDMELYIPQPNERLI